MTPDEKNQVLFIQLISIFQYQAMLHMGKMKHPVTEKIERDLAQAEQAIDMLDMIKEKTKASVTADEQKMLSTVLQELKINFVDEKAKGDTRPAVEHPEAQQ
jgi:cell division protein FtsB